MFESQYNDEMEAEVQRLEAKGRALAVGHPEWDNACAGCGCELKARINSRCESCSIVTVVAIVVAKQNSIATVKAELLKMVPLTRIEEGCIEYKLHQDNDHPDTFVFFENWQSLVHLEDHLQTAHFKAYVLAVEGKIEEKIVHKLTCLL